MDSAKFFRCSVCGNIVDLVHSGGGQLVCCGKPMIELKANTSDGATEKHVPVVEVRGNELDVKVGSVPHPMTEEHYIQWIAVETKDGIKRKYLKPGEKPEQVFCNEEGVVAVYEYCNLHGLWKAEL